MRNVLQGGRRAGIVTAFGVCTGLFVHAMLSALGVSIFLLHSATAFHVVKLAGAGYLVWLGVQSLHRTVRTPHSVDDLEAVELAWESVPQHCFLEGLLSNLLNPKAAVFYLAFLPQFIGPTESLLPKSLFLASIHYVEAIVWLSTMSIMLDHMRRFLLKAVVRRWLAGLCGVVLVGFGVRLALARQ